MFAFRFFKWSIYCTLDLSYSILSHFVSCLSHEANMNILVVMHQLLQREAAIAL